MDDKVTIVIPSCDAYQDAWEPFFHCFNRSWPDCPFEKVIITNYLDSPDPKTRAIKIGKDKGYCDNLKLALQQVHTEHIIIWVDDLLLVAIPKADLREIVQEAVSLDAGYLRLWKCSNKATTSNGLFRELDKGTKFRVSLKPALWKKSVLEELIISGETAHDLEKYGSIRSNDLDSKFLSLTTNSQQFRLITCNLIYRGKYEKVALKYLKSIGFEMDRSKRKVKPSLFYWVDHNILNPIYRLFNILGQ